MSRKPLKHGWNQCNFCFAEPGKFINNTFFFFFNHKAEESWVSRFSVCQCIKPFQSSWSIMEKELMLNPQPIKICKVLKTDGEILLPLFPDFPYFFCSSTNKPLSLDKVDSHIRPVFGSAISDYLFGVLKTDQRKQINHYNKVNEGGHH